MMEIINLKAIPVAFETNAYFLSKEELDVIKNTKYKEPEKGFYLSESISLLKNKTLASLEKFMIEKAEKYKHDVLGIKDQIYLTQSWSTINTTNAFHKPHFHPNTLISVVYFAQCKSGPLNFYLGTTSLRECFNFEYTLHKYTPYNSLKWELPLKNGDIVLFPGHLIHGSSPNQSPESRIIVGANFFIKGTLGSRENVSLITI